MCIFSFVVTEGALRLIRLSGAVKCLRVGSFPRLYVLLGCPSLTPGPRPLALVPSQVVCGEEKKCSFLCGTIWNKTKDPVDPTKKARWEFDVSDWTKSKSVGTCDWYCRRAWDEIAHTTEDRDRAAFIARMSKDKGIKDSFLERRKQIIQKVKQRGGHRKYTSDKRRGGRFFLDLCMSPSRISWVPNTFRPRLIWHHRVSNHKESRNLRVGSGPGPAVSIQPFTNSNRFSVLM